MAEAVYVLSALTSLACAVLLLRGYGRRKTPLLLWSGLCFLGFFFNNSLLFVDKVILTEQSLRMLRASSGLIGLFFLMYGLVWGSSSR